MLRTTQAIRASIFAGTFTQDFADWLTPVDSEPMGQELETSGVPIAKDEAGH